MCRRSILCVKLWLLCVVVLAFIWRYSRKNGERASVCWEDVTNAERLSCRLVCPNGTFALRGMSDCQDLLSCKDIKHEVHVLDLLASGTVKNVYVAKWKHHIVALSNLTETRLASDFQHNIQMYQLLGNADYTAQYIGSCNDTLVTEYFTLGSAAELHSLFNTKLIRYNTLSRRFSLCLSYVAILKYLHAHNRIMCDSNTLLKTLSQYLIYPDLTLRLNDMDALPYATLTEMAACGSPPLQGELLAPEQRGALLHESLCTTACDIWKIPDVCLWFLGKNSEAESFKFHLFSIHRRCKLHQPEERPSAEEVLKDYQRVWQEWMRGL
ncbi:protein O-mannose kinase-like [Rhipicephalus sanguineus]|uniref:protein O-mannose kinase-like n=1 Tax=Rhipicephalus sanguineus TaxID=34632 RepID=UPI001893C560|nr:protein O-mannose kinase-like [Rhipicephalus sanguineus]